MAILSQIDSAGSQPEMLVAFLATIALGIFAIWKSWHSLRRTQPTPDPWDETITAEMEKPEATPLCHRCLQPHSDSADFCSECGAPVGQYTNWLPFPQLFSIGHVLRTGTSGEFKRTPVTILGFILFSLAEYTLFAPIYWIIFLYKLSTPALPKNSTPDSAPSQQS
jgi:hypothetical protein